MDAKKYGLIVLVLAAGMLAADVSRAEAPQEPAAPAQTHVDAKTSASWRELSPEEDLTAEELRAEQLSNPKLVIMDARDDKSFDSMRIQGAVLAYPRDFYKRLRDYKAGVTPDQPDQMAELSKAMAEKYHKDTPIVTYCNRDCKASAGLLLRLKNLGYTNVRAMEEGVQAWQEKGFPVTIGVPRLSLETSE